MRGFSWAKKAAECSTHPQYRVGAALYKGSRLISTGWNSTKTHSRSNGRRKGYHAEFSALIGSSKVDTAGATIYVTRVYKDGSFAIARPCKHCRKMLESAGVKTVWYTDRDGNFQKEKL